jgi:hypothetical protein
MSALTRTTTAAVVALLALTGCLSTDPSAGNTPDRSSAPSSDRAGKPVLTKPDLADKLLFVARSQTATLDLAATGKGTLALESVPTMTWFSDRPRHDAGTTGTADGLKTFGWEKNGDTLGQNAPNAALTARDLTAAVVVELKSASLAGGELTFDVETVTKPASGARKTELAQAELFIDDAVESANRATLDYYNQVYMFVAPASIVDGKLSVQVWFGRNNPTPGPDVPGQRKTYVLPQQDPFGGTIPAGSVAIHPDDIVIVSPLVEGVVPHVRLDGILQMRDGSAQRVAVNVGGCPRNRGETSDDIHTDPCAEVLTSSA